MLFREQYSYTRAIMDKTYNPITQELIDGCYDINNPLRETTLSEEIKEAIPDLDFIVRCNHTVCDILTKRALTPSELELLDIIVSTHRANL